MRMDLIPPTHGDNNKNNNSSDAHTLRISNPGYPPVSYLLSFPPLRITFRYLIFSSTSSCSQTTQLFPLSLLLLSSSCGGGGWSVVVDTIKKKVTQYLPSKKKDPGRKEPSLTHSRIINYYSLLQFSKPN